MTLVLTYYGHSAFRLDDGEQAVLIDPFISGNPVATVAADDINARTILLTHAHNDHVGDTIAIAQRNGATVIATAELASWLGSQGVEHAVGANHGGTVQFTSGSTKFVPAWHTSSYSTADGVVAPGVPAGHVVRFGGKTIYFAGDTCLFLDMQLIGEEGLDVAVLPIGDHFTMGIKDAARAANILGAPTVIPCHYNTFPPIRQDAGEFARLVESQGNAKVLVLTPGSDATIG
jgi:L-ascorbate metabolism protein UlaG (beta-lactamase superfamily)